MAVQSDPERLPRLNWRERVFGSPARPSGNGSAGPPAATVLESPAATPPSSPTRSPANSTEDGSNSFPPLTIVRTGQSVWVKRAPGDKLHWTNRDFALEFLCWLVAEYPDCRDGWVNVPDLEQDFFDRFREAVGCSLVEDGALFRGLTEVLGRQGKRDQAYRSALGERCWVTEYRVPASAEAVIELAAAKAKRA